MTNQFKWFRRQVSILLSIALLVTLIPALGATEVKAASIVDSSNLVEDFEGFTAGFNFGTGSANKKDGWRANAAGGPWFIGTDESKAVYLNNTTAASNTAMWNETFNAGTSTTSKGNMLVSAKVKIISNGSGGFVGIAARLGSANDNYLLNIREGVLEIRRKTATSSLCAATNTSISECVLASAPIPGFSTNVYYTLTFLVNGTTLIGSINGGPTLKVTNSSLLETTTTNRSVGFRGASPIVAYIDDVRVTQDFPTAPTNLLKQAALDGKVIISWGSVANEQGYKVKRSSAVGGPYTTIATVTQTTYMDTVANGTTYYYTISPLAAAADGTLLDSTLSNEVSATPQAAVLPPAVPTGINKSVGDANVALHWNASGDATGYIIKRSGQIAGSYTTIANLPATSSSFTDSGLNYGMTYYYKITAVNSMGTTDSAVVDATPSYPPATPTGLLAVPGNGKISLSWNAVNGADSYTVYRSTSANGSYSTIAQSVYASTYLDQGPAILNNTNYFYTVKAVSQEGISGQSSNVAAATPKDKYLETKTPVTASSNDGNVPSQANDNSLNSRWGSEGIGQWIRYDLGALSSIGYVGLAFYKGDSRSTQFEIYSSDDDTIWNKVYSGASSGASNQLEAFKLTNIQARYIKIVGKGNSNNDYIGINEVQIYAPNPNGIVLDTVPYTPPSAPLIKPVKAGLYNPNGSPYAVPGPNLTTGATIDVTNFIVSGVTYGADPIDNNVDDRAAIQKAIDSAAAGDEVYFPNGVYNLKSAHPNSASTNLILKNGVNLRGESQDGVVLLSDFDNRKQPDHSSLLSNGSSRVLQGFNLKNVQISNLTISSTWDWIYPTDPTETAYAYKGGPKNGIYLDEPSSTDAPNAPSYVWIDHVTIEKFEKTGIRISRAHDIVVQNSTFRKATDIGGGGAGYGIALQGIFKEDRYGLYNDTQHNIIRNNVFDGTDALRHGVIIQAYAHNNAIYGNRMINTTYDSIDLHGEFEYMNEVYNNTVVGTKQGAGIGLGNTGGGYPSNHSATGPFNYIHDNLIQNTMQGMLIYMGTPDTIIENNTIEWTLAGDLMTNGIDLMNAPRTIIRGNTIRGFAGSTSSGIYVQHDLGDRNANFIGAGDPQDVVITDNTITGNTNGITVDIGTGTVLSNNTVQENMSSNMQVNPAVQVYNRLVTVSEDTYVTKAQPTAVHGNLASAFMLNTNKTGLNASIAYFKFNVTDIADASKASLQLSGRVTDSNPGADSFTFDVFGITDDSWSEGTTTWLNSPNHSADGTITGVPATATLLGSVTISGDAINSYSISTEALLNFIRSQSDGIVSFAVVDTRQQDAHVEIYAKESPFESIRAQLKLSLISTNTSVSNNASLSNLSVMDGMTSLNLTPTFASGTTEYSLNVDNRVNSLEFKASPIKSKSAIKINGIVQPTDSGVTISSLQVGANLVTVEVTAEDGITKKNYQVTVNRAFYKSNNGGGNTSGSSTSAPSDNGTGTVVNPNNQATLIATEIKSIDGKQIASSLVNRAMIDNALLNSHEGTLRLTTGSSIVADQIRITLNNEAIQKIVANTTIKSLSIETLIGNYELPLKQIVLQDLAAKLGVAVDLISIEISFNKAVSASDKANASGQKVLGAVEFTVKAASPDGRSIEITAFTQYVPRTIKVDNVLSVGKLSAVRIEEDNKGNTVYEPVPFIVNGSEAVLYSRTNSTYLLLENNLTFADIQNHWAKADIEHMANRKLVQGTAQDTFQPDQALTRAEFAALVTRTLGLKPEVNSSMTWSDVNSNDWFAGYVYAAAKAGILTGYEDQTYHPNQPISRQEMSVMIYRAMKYAGFDGSEQASNVQAVNRANLAIAFTDADLIQDWAKEAVAVISNKQIVDGVASGKFDPAATATRAQSAVILKRMLAILTFTN